MITKILYLYEWKESGRMAIFPYLLNTPPNSLQFLGKFYGANELYEFIKIKAKMSPEKTLSRNTYKSCKIKDYTYLDCYSDFIYIINKDSNSKQLKLFDI
jgi:hypothetical protein